MTAVIQLPVSRNDPGSAEISYETISEQPWDLIKLGKAAFAAKNLSRCIHLLFKATKMRDCPWEAYLYLGMAYALSGRLSLAKQSLKKILAWCPDIALKSRAAIALKEIDYMPAG